MTDRSYAAVMARRGEILRRATGIDYQVFEQAGLAFDYDRMMASTGYDVAAAAVVQRGAGVGRTPLLELGRLTELVRAVAPAGKGH